jgi:hypothetical protein
MNNLETEALALEFRSKYPEARDYKTFSSIPKELQTEDFIIAWLTTPLGRLINVPHEIRTERMMRISVSYDASAFLIINPEDIFDYQGLILDALEFSTEVSDKIRKEYLTEDFIIELSRRKLSELLNFGLAGKNKHLLTDRVISSIVQSSVASASFLNMRFSSVVKGRIRDEDLKLAVINNFNFVGGLVGLNKECVLSDMLKEGYWPPVTNNYVKDDGDKADMTHPPTSPGEAMERLADSESRGMRLLHMQSLKIFPIEDVIASTQGIPNATDILLEAYSEKELKPHMRLSRELRGRLLETGLGL